MVVPMVMVMMMVTGDSVGWCPVSSEAVTLLLLSAPHHYCCFMSLSEWGALDRPCR